MRFESGGVQIAFALLYVVCRGHLSRRSRNVADGRIKGRRRKTAVEVPKRFKPLPGEWERTPSYSRWWQYDAGGNMVLKPPLF